MGLQVIAPHVWHIPKLLLKICISNPLDIYQQLMIWLPTFLNHSSHTTDSVQCCARVRGPRGSHVRSGDLHVDQLVVTEATDADDNVLGQLSRSPGLVLIVVVLIGENTTTSSC